MREFESAYDAYGEFQRNMERYWCLRWLGQEQAKQVDAVVLKDEVVRLVEIPLVARLAGMPQLARGAQVKLDIVRWDEVDLSLEARLLEVAAVAPDTSLELEEEEEGDTGEAALAEVVEAEGVVAAVTTEEGVEVPANAGTA
jgi:exoribonuclease-2